MTNKIKLFVARLLGIPQPGKPKKKMTMKEIEGPVGEPVEIVEDETKGV